MRVGALVRHADILRATNAGSGVTFGAVASAAPWVSDPLVRNRGTLCGAVAHCDPEGDWNSVLLATGADVIARGSNGERVIPITEFIVDFFDNSLADDEMVTEVHIPVPSGRGGRLVPEARAQGRRLRDGGRCRAPRARGRRHHRGAGLASLLSTR